MATPHEEVSDPTIKKIKVTGSAAESLSPALYDIQDGGKRGSGGASRKKGRKVLLLTATKEGGGATSPGTIQQLAASHIPGSNSSRAVGASSAFTDSGATVGKLAPSLASPVSSATSVGPPTGGANPRVILAKSKKKTSKVMLAAPKHSKPTSTGQLANTLLSKKRKTAKKVHVSLAGLGKKLRNAKTIRNKASKHTFEDVKKELVKAGLIKEDSKAPESILRQMYADFMVLKKKAL
jgi:hypothetical protein